MPAGKGRSNKRSSSGTSYASTATTVVFVALCIIGLWMITSNSIISPQTTTQTASTTTSTADSSSTTNSHNTKIPEKKQTPVYEDNPGDLPEDAIKSDQDTNENQKSSQDDQKYAKDSTDDLESSSGSANEAESNNNDKEENAEKQESEEENGAAENKNVIKQESEQKNGGDNKNEENAKEEVSVVEENLKGLQGKDTEVEQKKHGTPPSSEEIRQTGDAQEINGKSEENQKDTKLEKNEDSKHTQHQTSNEEQEHRMEQEEEQNPPPEQHEDEPIKTSASSQEVQNSETKIEEVKQTETPSKSTPEGDTFPSGVSSGIPKESKESKKSWSTQADQSDNQKERRKGGSVMNEDGSAYGYPWQLCNVTAGADYIPCLDNEKAVKKLRSTKHYEHRERHCPEAAPTCLVPVPQGYKRPVEWPNSREKIWYHNVPHTKLAEVKGHQNWVKMTGEFLTFPGGGTQFIHGALHYIDFIQEAVPEIAWGKHTRVILDVGCGVASFGGFLFDRDVLAMSLAPKDEHEAQVQFALERGIPAISAVMGSKRLPFPSRVFDLVHCARCRVPWHEDGGALLLELNRMLRPGGYFVWSATPVYQKLEEDVQIWKEMTALTVSMCWELVTIKKDKLNSIGAAIYHKPDSNECYEERKHNRPPMCKSDDDSNAAWYVPLQSCMHRVPVAETERGSQWPEEWPRRLQTPPYWLNRSQMGIYGKPSPDDFAADYEHWKRVVSKSYLSGLGITLSNTRNIMDMRAVYGGFAAAMKDLKVWVLNVVNIDSPDTLPIIYERGLFGIYHDWCESFSTYPRSYDLLHADHLFSRLKKRCKIVPVMAEIDRIVRPGGKLIVRDESSTIGEVENLLKSLHWEVHLTFSKNQEGILSAQKSDWRPDSYAAPS